MTTTARTAAVVGGAVLLIATSVSAASAGQPSGTPPETGCPAAAQVFDVSSLSALGYRVPRMLDENGNNNGIVCGIPIQEQAARQIFPPNTCLSLIGCFLFSDDTLTNLH